MGWDINGEMDPLYVTIAAIPRIAARKLACFALHVSLASLANKLITTLAF